MFRKVCLLVLFFLSTNFVAYPQQFNLVWEKSYGRDGRFESIGDFNGDNSIDFVYYNNNDTLIIFDYNMHELFSVIGEFLDIYDWVIDFTGDGYMEVIRHELIGSYKEKIGIYDLIQKRYIFEYTSKFSRSYNYPHLSLRLYGDANGDGFIDFIISDYDEPQDTFIEILFSTNVSITKLQNESNIFHGFNLNQNFPNPFNPTTTIEYALPRRERAEVSVFDILGREVAVLENQEKDAGDHKIKFDGSNLSSGVYFYRMRAGNYSNTKKFLLLK